MSVKMNTGTKKTVHKKKPKQNKTKQKTLMLLVIDLVKVLLTCKTPR